MADALTPPPNKMLTMAMAYHQTVLVHLAQKMEIPDLLAGGPRTAAAVAAAVRSEASIVERLLYACAANGVFQLGPAAADGTPQFVNTALSAVLRKDHPNSLKALVGHNAEDMYDAWGKLPEALANPSGPVAWDLANPKFPFKKGGIWAKFEAQPASKDQYGRAITALDSLDAATLVADGPWARFKRWILAPHQHGVQASARITAHTLYEHLTLYIRRREAPHTGGFLSTET